MVDSAIEEGLEIGPNIYLMVGQYDRWNSGVDDTAERGYVAIVQDL